MWEKIVGLIFVLLNDIPLLCAWETVTRTTLTVRLGNILVILFELFSTTPAIEQVG